jgi:hypothetical protein
VLLFTVGGDCFLTGGFTPDMHYSRTRYKATDLGRGK